MQGRSKVKFRVRMCDSTISVSCPADFTSYCPASALCDEDIRPQKKRRHRSSVRSRVALFSRKAKGQMYPRQGISSQQRIKPLGEDSCISERTSLYSNSCSEHEMEASPLEWSSESTEDEEGATTQDNSWLHEQPSSYVSAEELHALRGCVTRGRAVFSPTPFSDRSSELSKVGIRVDPQTGMPNADPSMSDKLLVPQTDLIHIPGQGNEVSHARQGSFEYDHLEDFHPDQAHESSDSRNSFCDSHPDQQPPLADSACSVSVQFGSTGYECKAVCETDSLPATHNPPSSQMTQETVQPQNEVLATATVANVAKAVESGDVEVSCGKSVGARWLPLSQSIPGRLNSPNLRFGHSTTSGVCHCPSCCPCGSFQRKISSLSEEASKQQLSHCPLPVTVSHLPKVEQRDRCNSWPRHKICPLAQYGNDAKHFQKRPSIQVQLQTVPTGSPTLIHSPHLRSSPRHKVGSVPNFSLSEAVDRQDVSYQQIPHVESSVSLKSMSSLRTFRSGSNSSSCCERHVGYVKGVDGKVYKKRVDVSLM